MNIVVDANIVAAQVLPLPYTPQAQDHFTGWLANGNRIIAPLLLEYEIATILRRSVVAGSLRADTIKHILDRVFALGIVSMPPTAELHNRALFWASRIGQAKAYDAHYLALAEREKAILWTADKRLAKVCRQQKIRWVRSILVLS